MPYRILIPIFGLLACVCFQAHAQMFNIQGQIPTLRVSDQLIVNYFDSDPKVFENHLVVTDVDGAGPVVNILVYDDSGRLLDEQYYFLPVFGKVNYDPSERLANRKFRGTIKIFADGGNVAAQYWQFHKDEDLNAFNTAIPAFDAEGSTALLCQHFVADPKIDSRLILTNPSSDSAVTAAVTFYLDRGKQLSRDRYRIPPNGSIKINPYEANEGLIRTGVAYCEVVGGIGQITGEYWQASEKEEYQISLPLEIIPKRARDW